MLGVIFRKAQNRIQDSAKLKRLIALIDEETWMGLDIDIKGEIYEGLLQKNAEDTKSGAGQYFTPCPLIKAMVEVMRPQPGMTICDSACGTGGFFLAAHDYISNNYPLDRDQKNVLRYDTFKGWEIVDNTARLCVMNIYLHGIGGEEFPSTPLARRIIRDPSLPRDDRIGDDTPNIFCFLPPKKITPKIAPFYRLLKHGRVMYFPSQIAGAAHPFRHVYGSGTCTIIGQYRPLHGELLHSPTE